MKHSEKGENIDDEEREIIARGFGNKMHPIHLRHSALQEMANEKHASVHRDITMSVLGNDVGSTGKITILGNQLKREQNGILKKL